MNFHCSLNFSNRWPFWDINNFLVRDLLRMRKLNGNASSDPFFSGKPTVNTGTESTAQDDGEFGAFASSSDAPEFGNFANFEPSSMQNTQKEVEDSEFGSFSSSRDDFGSFSSGPVTSTAFSPSQPLPPTPTKTNIIKVRPRIN